MINTTLCYLQRGEEYLMLHRVKKENDLNQDKWIGVGGKFEDKESPEDCALREIRRRPALPRQATATADSSHSSPTAGPLSICTCLLSTAGQVS